MNHQSRNRMLEPEDRERWLEELAVPRDEKRNRQSAKSFVFRCGDEWFGLDPVAVVSVAPMSPVHSIPNRPPGLAGVVNYRGAITLCFSLEKLLQCNTDSASGQGMLLALRHNDWLIACVVDEVAGMVAYDSSEMKPPPATLSGGAAGRVAGLFSSQGRSIACLDVVSLFNTFKEAVS